MSKEEAIRRVQYAHSANYSRTHPEFQEKLTVLLTFGPLQADMELRIWLVLCKIANKCLGVEETLFLLRKNKFNFLIEIFLNERKHSGQIGKLSYLLDKTITGRMPMFFAQFLDQIFLSVSTISALTYEEFEKLVSESQLLVNVEYADIRKTHLIALHEPKFRKCRKEPEIGILCAGMDSTTVSWEYVCPSENIDFINKIQVSSLISYSIGL